MLAAGKIDALLGARKPNALGASLHVARLFPNYREVEREFYKKTGVFPIMHTLVIKEDLYRQKPWVAESIYKACEERRLGVLSRCSSAARFAICFRGFLQTSMKWPRFSEKMHGLTGLSGISGLLTRWSNIWLASIFSVRR